MKAKVINFPNFFRPATPRDEPCVVLPLVWTYPERECPKIVELRRQSKLLREHFKPKRGM